MKMRRRCVDQIRCKKKGATRLLGTVITRLALLSVSPAHPRVKRDRFCMPLSSIPADIGVQFQGTRFDVVQHAELILGGILGHRAEKFTVCLHEL